jgi:hypothetical protein
MLRRSRGEMFKATFLLNRVALCAVIIALGATCLKAAHSKSFSRNESEFDSTSKTEEKSAGSGPDIYYIILDAYTRQDNLRDLFHFDNAQFLSFLGVHGFYVADKSYSNYPWTLFSLSSSLNMDYLSGGAPEGEAKGDFDIRVQNQFRDNKVVAFLRDRGYECVSFTSGYSATDGMRTDSTLKPGLLLGEFENILINMTPIRVALGRLEYVSQYAMHRKRVLFTLDRLPKIERHGRPLFVFAHVTIPHPPFVLDCDGNATRTDRPFVLKDGNQFFETGGTEDEYIRGYLGQLEYVNSRMKTIIEAIESKSPDAVIVVQGDHGSRLRLTSELSTTNLREAVGILNAYRLPGRDASELLKEDISPVNTFRVIFNTYFGASYPLLENHHFSGEGLGNFVFKEITERLN